MLKKLILIGPIYSYLLQVDGQRVGLCDPRGTTVHNAYDRVYIADCGCNCMFVFQTNGQFCHTIGKGQVTNISIIIL